MIRTYIEERTYYPDGCAPDDTDASSFRVGVYYRGNGKWCVARQHEAHEQLTRTGRWLRFPLKMTAMRWCRFTFPEACALAEEHVDGVTVMGRTWAQWQAHHAAQAKAAEHGHDWHQGPCANYAH